MWLPIHVAATTRQSVRVIRHTAVLELSLARHRPNIHVVRPFRLYTGNGGDVSHRRSVFSARSIMRRAYAYADWLSYGLAAGLTRCRAGTDVAHGDFPYTFAPNFASGM